MDDHLNPDNDQTQAAQSGAGVSTADQYENAFTGGYQHSLDSKGRLIVPLPFRDALGSPFCIGPSFDFKAIALYPDIVWKKTRADYQRLSRFNSKLKLYLENFDAMSYRGQECDGQGRVLLPARLRQKLLGEEKEVEVLGGGDHVRILARSASEEQFSNFLDTLPDILDEMDRLGSAHSGD